MTNVILIRPELPKALTRVEAKQRIAEVLSDSSNLRWTAHVRQRMYQRDITDLQVLHVLRRGEVTKDPRWSDDRNWEVTMEALTAGDQVRVGMALDVDARGFFVVVITAIVL